MEFRHVVAEKLGDRVIGDFAVVGDQSRRELNVCLDGVHQWRVAKRQDAAKMLLADGCSDLSRDVSMTPDGLRVNPFFP